MQRVQVLAVAALAAVGCSAGQLGDQSHEPTTSPGTVTLRLVLPAGESFCDVVDSCSYPTHVFIGKEPGNWLTAGSASSCAVDCSTCKPQPCPALAPIICPAVATGVAVTDVEATWNGAYTEWSTCGNGVTCYNARFVPPGRYAARLCATQGMFANTTCTQTAPQECVDATFDLPGPPLVLVPLPQTIIN